MQTQIPSRQAKQNQSHSEQKTPQSAQSQFEDSRPESTAQLRMQSLMANSAQSTQLKSRQAMMVANTPAKSLGQSSSAINAAPLQRMEEDEPLQAKVDDPVQREPAESSNAETPDAESLPDSASPQKPNNTGLPDQLKTGIENLSGISMAHVKVHYNSDKPAQLQAHAYAQGSEIHLAPGQEKHLPHEAWHVVQQAQGRVRPTVQMKGDIQANDDAGLEREADVMGARALKNSVENLSLRTSSPHVLIHPQPATSPVQMLLEPISYDTRYQGPLHARQHAANNLRDDLNQRVDAAYQQSMQWRTLQGDPNPMVQLWFAAAHNYAQNPDVEPRVIHARFGYSVEALACQGLNNTQLYGLNIQTQVAHGHTRPDVVASVGDDDVAWLDITSEGSVGHIRGKDGAGWNNTPFVWELIYPQLQLRELLNATDDAYYQELGGFLANERQVELNVKERNSTQLRNLLVAFRDERGWTTGTGNQEAKRRATRDFFMREAADEGVEDESQSIINTKGALVALDINPGPYGFNNGGGQSNQRLNQVVDAASEQDINVGKGQLSAATTQRILSELGDTGISPALLEEVREAFFVDPAARATALAAMALKGVLQDFGRLENLLNYVRSMLPGDNPRVVALEQSIQGHMQGPQHADHATLMQWRQETQALATRTAALTQVLRAITALHQYELTHGINFFNRPPIVTQWVQLLAQDPPSAQAAQQFQLWLAQQP